jgi:hypothetical protein
MFPVSEQIQGNNMQFFLNNISLEISFLELAYKSPKSLSDEEYLPRAPFLTLSQSKMVYM